MRTLTSRPGILLFSILIPLRVHSPEWLLAWGPGNPLFSGMAGGILCPRGP